MKKKRIRIHQNTLLMINRPDHIHLLISPESQTIAICVCTNKDKDAIQIRYTQRDCEIYSGDLMDRIVRLNDRIKENRTYRLTGVISENDRMITFRLDEAICTDDGKEPKRD